MKKMVAPVLIVIAMAFTMTGCDGWWKQDVVKGWDDGSVWKYGNCTVNLPADQNSGWVKAKVDSSTYANGAANSGVIDSLVTFTVHNGYPRTSGPDKRLWNNGPTGEKVIIGIFPGETYIVGLKPSFPTYTPSINIQLKTRVVDGNNVTLNSVPGVVNSSQAGCTLVSS